MQRCLLLALLGEMGRRGMTEDDKGEPGIYTRTCDQVLSSYPAPTPQIQNAGSSGQCLDLAGKSVMTKQCLLHKM